MGHRADFIVRHSAGFGYSLWAIGRAGFGFLLWAIGQDWLCAIGHSAGCSYALWAIAPNQLPERKTKQKCF
jgi:hypothetical protein